MHAAPLRLGLARSTRSLVRRSSLVPIVYAVLGGFRDTASSSSNPVGAARPVGVRQLHRASSGPATFWRQVVQQHAHRARSTLLIVPLAAMAAFVFARFAFRGPRGPLHALHARAAVPGRGGDPADLHHGPQPRAARQPARRRPAAGRVRAAARRSSSCGRSSAASRPSSRTPRRSTAAARSASSGGSCCRCRARCWPRSSVLAIVGSWNTFLLPLVVFTDPSRLDAAARRRPTSPRSTRPTPPGSSPSRRCRWCRR